MKISAGNVKKKIFFFSLEGVLMPGNTGQRISLRKAASLLSFMASLEKQGLIQIFLVVGLQEEKAREKISASGTAKFFSPERIFFVTKEYIDSKGEIDRARHVASLESDPWFADEFFKQHILMQLIASGKILREETVLVGHDLWFDAFYTSRFSGVDFALIKESLSERNSPVSEKIQWLNCVRLSRKDFEKIILGKSGQNNVKLLEARVFEAMGKELLKGVDLSGIGRPRIA